MTSPNFLYLSASGGIGLESFRLEKALKVAEARKLIFAGIIGLAIILSAWAIAKFVLLSLQKATGSGTDALDEQTG